MKAFEKDVAGSIGAHLYCSKARNPIASIAIVGPSYRLSKDRLPALGEALRNMMQQISSEIGPVALSAIVAKIRTR